jgi:hypothetical protein
MSEPLDGFGNSGAGAIAREDIIPPGKAVIAPGLCKESERAIGDRCKCAVTRHWQSK